MIKRIVRIRKHIAVLLITVQLMELLSPKTALALSTGPSQPEVMTFEPVGTTDMVNMFSGDFVYNIPLMDVEGYPINLSYHGGTNIEQEASWVGLGWNVNPGVINRSVRGVPDDFNGETIEKDLHIKGETNLRVGLAIGLEQLGKGEDPPSKITANVEAGAYLNFNNYKGVSCDLTLGGGLNIFPGISLGVNYGIGSQTGADIDYNAGINLTTKSTQQVSKELVLGVGVRVDGGYNTRTGIKDRNMSYTFRATVTNYGSSDSKGNSEKTGESQSNKSESHTTDETPYSSWSSSITANRRIPIGLTNYVPVTTNSSTMRAIYGRIKVGGEMSWCFAYGQIKGMYSAITHNNDGSRPSYGYLYLQNGDTDNNAILDFTRDKDGLFNETMKYLPAAALTYDIYSVNGQGTGGQFRPYRNDFGSVYDPKVASTQKSNSFGVEAGFGNLFSLGADYARVTTEAKSGHWGLYKRDFSSNTSGSIYENVYFREAGELTSADNSYASTVGGTEASTPDQAMANSYQRRPGSEIKRDPRGNLIYYNTAANAISGNIYSYNDDSFTGGANPSKTLISRTGGSRKAHHISEIIQLQKDGRMFCFGIPAMVNYQKEATFSVEPTSVTDAAAGVVSFTPGLDDAVTNGNGIDNFYSGVTTPGYAHSYLLSSVLSTDYVDVTGDGTTDDDLGTFTKFNYSLKQSDYHWKIPYDSAKAMYEPGYYSEKRDDKGTYITGSREHWYLHSVESKNYISEFYTSSRDDGKGSNGAGSFKLDSIRLFNKHDRFINGANAVPIKTVLFVYDYTLCTGVPNSTGQGKLTLRKVYFRYGYSQKSMISPYQFGYGFNPNYSLSNINRWGEYKAQESPLNNYEFPYVNQNDSLNNYYASAWSLTDITLPSGGKINVTYEADDYAYVQNKAAMEMFKIRGLGTGPDFGNGNELYHKKKSPVLYAYFDRRISSENPSMSFQDNYLPDLSCMNYSFFVKLAEKEKTYERIKGYAEIEKIGKCSDSVHGYIKFKPVTIAGGGAIMNPVSFTALNVGRYNLPQIIYPGADPDESNIANIMKGLKRAFRELISAHRNPLILLIKKEQGKVVNIDKSYIRLQCVGQKKKGGGQRVKKLVFSDSWKTIAGGNEPDATYGKEYKYTIGEGANEISSGVASYEPLVGGDENPFRVPFKYSVTKGSHFPPVDPVELYQEAPLLETFYPPASVGYSKVTVSSIHADYGKSAQGVDVYQFYTAKDFPVRAKATAIESEHRKKYNFFKQEQKYSAKQGFSLILNDMHGKPKSVEHYARNKTSNTLQPITYQVYNYKHTGDELNNTVNCLVPSISGGVGVMSREVGTETDLTLDSREKTELTKNFALNCNLNVTVVAGVPIPIPFFFPWYGQYSNEFRSATATKITQQYGILDNVVSYNEGVVTRVKNELFDFNTGEPVVTSVNNEYSDKRYDVSIPAAWCYDGMSSAYDNINYEFDAPYIDIDTNFLGRILLTTGSYETRFLHIGDEYEISYYSGGLPYSTRVWLMGSTGYVGESTSPPNFVCPGYQVCCLGYVLPRFPHNTPGWDSAATITNVHARVVRSGARNMLKHSIEDYSLQSSPLTFAGNLSHSFASAINLSARTYCDSNTRIPFRYIHNPDTINPYVIGERGVYKLLNEYAYVTNRSYSGTSARNAGLFHANTLFGDNTASSCVSNFPYRALAPNSTDASWRKARTITKWSPNGKELENMDAIDNFSTAIFGYNGELPVAVSSNVKHGDLFADGFEDYHLLRNTVDLVRSEYSPFEKLFSSSTFSGSYSLRQLNGTSGFRIVDTFAHTGRYSIFTKDTDVNIPGCNIVSLPIFSAYGYTNNHYNSYYPYGSGVMGQAQEYQPFKISIGKKYILSYWIRQSHPSSNLTEYSLSSYVGMLIGTTTYPVVKKSNIIDGWQQVEVAFTVPVGSTSVSISLPLLYYIDDIRIFPADANMKSFVYNSVNQKLMATLDENNFAVMYEYDQEGNLVRKKKETEKGIITISESRSSNSLQ